MLVRGVVLDEDQHEVNAISSTFAFLLFHTPVTVEAAKQNESNRITAAPINGRNLSGAVDIVLLASQSHTLHDMCFVCLRGAIRLYSPRSDRVSEQGLVTRPRDSMRQLHISEPGRKNASNRPH